MKKIVRVLATALAAVMSMTSIAIAETGTAANNTEVFKDVDTNTDMGKAISEMYELGYLAGYEDGTFKPNGEITRAELVRVINQVMKYSSEDKIVTDNAGIMKDFADNTTGDKGWYYEDVRIAQSYGYIKGFEDNTFRPRENFTRQQVCVVLSALAELDDTSVKVQISDEVSEWAVKYVNNAIAYGLMSLEANNTFRATKNITRGEVCLALVPFITEEAVIISGVVTDSSGEAVTNAEGSTMTTTVKSIVSTGGSGTIKKPTTTAATTEAVTEMTTVNNKETTTNKNNGITETTTKKDNGTTEITTKKGTNVTETTTKKDVNVTTTEKATETTTAKLETTTESTTEAVTIDAGTLKIMNRVIRNMNRYVKPACSTDAQGEVADAIVNAMQAYINDPSYDFQVDAEEAMSMYKSLDSDEKKELKDLIISKNALSDLLALQEKFFPGMM